MGSQEEFRRKKRRRKTKTERDKGRTSVASQVHTEMKHDVGRHLKTARNVSYPLRSFGCIASDSTSNISHSRLTRRLGIYNQSKTSRKVSREPVVVPETVRKKTEEDLKKILDLTEKMPALLMEVDTDMPSPSATTTEKAETDNKSSATVLYGVHSSGISLPSTSHEVTPFSLNNHNPNARHSVKSTASGSSLEIDDDVEEEFPSSPPMAGIAEYLCSELQHETMFQDRDLVQEICVDLVKNFKNIGVQTVTSSDNQNKIIAKERCDQEVRCEDHSDKENIDEVPTAEIIISQNLLTSEAKCKLQIHGDHKSTHLHESKNENIRRDLCRALLFSEPNKKVSYNTKPVLSKENDKRQECADALILLGQTTGKQENETFGRRDVRMLRDTDTVLLHTSAGSQDEDYRKMVKKESSPDALTLLVQNDNNEATMITKKADCLTSFVNNPLQLHQRNFRMENEYQVRDTYSKPGERNFSYYQLRKTSPMNNYAKMCGEKHSKELKIPGIRPQSSGFHSHYSQISASAMSLDHLLECDRNESRCLDEYTFVTPRDYKKYQRPLESHRQNLALAIQSAARPWGKDTPLPERKKKAVVTEYQQHPEFMPRFHGDFYKDALLFQDDVWPNDDRQSGHSLTKQADVNENMDILEYLDQSQETHSHSVDDGLHRHSRISYSRKLLQPGSPDSDGSPTWIAPDTLQPWKPKLDSPESPQKMYPRRLY